MLIVTVSAEFLRLISGDRLRSLAAMRLLLVEDDQLIAEPLVKALTDQNYVIDLATDGQAGWELADAFTYDLILLDVMLPQLDGISLCRRLRAQGNRTLILLLTTQDTVNHKVMGLDAGADDYLAKPFDLEELLARIRALLRRGSAILPPLLKWENLHLDPNTCEVTYNGQPLHLTPKEYGLLELFLRNRQRVFSYDVILDHLWSLQDTPGDDTIRAHIKGLRQKLKLAGMTQDPIETVYGLGYRLKPESQPGPRQPKPSKNQLSGIDSKTNQPSEAKVEQQTLAEVTGVWERTQAKLSQRVAVIEQATTALLQTTLRDELRQRAIQAAHKLVGSLGMFGFAEGSRLAQEIEQLFQAQVDLEQHSLHLSELVLALSRELQQTPTGQSPKLISVDQQTLLLIVSQDQPLAKALVQEADNWNMQGLIVPEPGNARQVIQSTTSARPLPDAVVLDLSLDRISENSLTFLVELSALTPPVPVLVLTSGDSLIDRVEVARLGGRGFLQKPVSPVQILESVTQVLQRFHPAEARVLVVDDDPQILGVLQDLLAPWGIKLFTLDQPLQFWTHLETVAPDLLVLDVEMPDVNGIELCQVVRNDPHWSNLPVLFLTAHTDLDTRRRVFAAGADDYVSKPVVGPELVTRILNRLARSRLIQSLAETDTLTRVANRRKSTQQLNQLLQLAERHAQPLCFALVEVDHLQQINRQYGYPLGDQILACLGDLLRQAFRSGDVVGRWGGAFAVGIYGLTCGDGSCWLSELLDSLRQIKFKTQNTSLQVTFSAGVAQYPQDGATLPALHQAASAMLEQAKALEGNRILPMGWPRSYTPQTQPRTQSQKG